MYLLAITLSLCITYSILFFLFPFFFEKRTPQVSSKSLISIGSIFLLSIIGYVIAFNIPNAELSNRFLHGFGGGFMAFLVCFLVAKDSKTKISKFQFFIFSILIVVALGVANEILEFFLQNYAGLIFSTSINDTWLDLISNTVGVLIGAIFLTPFIARKSHEV